MSSKRLPQYACAAIVTALFLSLAPGGTGLAAPLFGNNDTSRAASDRRPSDTNYTGTCDCNGHIVLAASREEIQRQLDEVEKELRRRKKEQERQLRREAEEQRGRERDEQRDRERQLRAAQEEIARRQQQQADEAQRQRAEAETQRKRQQQAESAKRREVQRKLDEVQRELERRRRQAEEIARQQREVEEAQSEQSVRREKELQLRAAQEELERRQRRVEEQSRRIIARQLEEAKRELEARRQQQADEQRQAEESERRAAQRRLDEVQRELQRRKGQQAEEQSQHEAAAADRKRILRKLDEAKRELEARQRQMAKKAFQASPGAVDQNDSVGQIDEIGPEPKQRLLDRAKAELVQRQRKLVEANAATSLTTGNTEENSNTSNRQPNLQERAINQLRRSLAITGQSRYSTRSKIDEILTYPKRDRPYDKPLFVNIPEAPPGVDVDENIRYVEEYRRYLMAKDTNSLYPRFIQMYRNEWDYKRLDPVRYWRFGNFHYGATMAAMGVPLRVALGGAGWQQQIEGNSSKEWGSFLDFFDGDFSYMGDDPADRVWIEKGYDYYQNYYKK